MEARSPKPRFLMANKLDALFSYLDALTVRPARDDLIAHLARLELTDADLAPFIRFSDRQYQLNLVKAGASYHVWVLCWKNGQRSPIHDHPGSMCGVRVLRGTATVTH